MYNDNIKDLQMQSQDQIIVLHPNDVGLVRYNDLLGSSYLDVSFLNKSATLVYSY